MTHVAKWFGGGSLAFHKKQVDWVNDTVKVALTTSTYVPDQDNHTTWSQVTNELAATGGYTAGGTTLTGKTATYDGPTNTVRLQASNAVWSSASFTARVAVIYAYNSGTPSASILLGYVVFDADETVSTANFTIQWDSTDGVLRVVLA